METALRLLLDKQAIQDVLLRYCRGIDRMDQSLVRACYHPDAQDEHGSFCGGVDAFIDWVWRLLGRYRMSMHYLTQTLIEVSGDAAVAESYGISIHEGLDDRAVSNLIVGFRYVDRFERRGGEWRIARRVCTTEWVRRDDPSSRWPVSDHLRKGLRGQSDIVYELLSELR